MPLQYTRTEAKEWAKKTWFGCCNIVMPTFTQDRERLNRKAIIHDINRSYDLGFWGTLLKSECGTTLSEMEEFMDIAVANRPSENFHYVLLGSFNTLEEIQYMAKKAEEKGIDALLLAYPPSFFPQDKEEIYEFTKSVAMASNLAMIIFAVPTWDFVRFHPSQFPPDIIEKMTDIDTVVAVKYECGRPGTGGMVEIQHRIGGKVLISDPLEQNCPAWIKAYGMPWMGTSNYEYFADLVPRYHRLFNEGKWDEGFKLYWQVQPARLAKMELMNSVVGAKLIHRAAWKYMQWLVGFNGGPLRMPQMRVDAASMKRYRDALTRSGIPVTEEPDSQFFVGRNPE